MTTGYPLTLLNAAILTADGDFTLTTVDVAMARELVQAHGFVSLIGHDSTARLLSDLLGADIPVNRSVFEQQPGQKALVFKLNGRLPEGTVLNTDELHQIGFSLKLLVRHR